jgi:hypothetical protein
MQEAEGRRGERHEEGTQPCTPKSKHIHGNEKYLTRHFTKVKLGDKQQIKQKWYKASDRGLN